VKLDELDDYVAHFRTRVLQDALAQATAAYWRRRAVQFAMVGTPACDEIAEACYNASRIALGGDLA
jgi:hypothetical protein